MNYIWDPNSDRIILSESQSMLDNRAIFILVEYWIGGSLTRAKRDSLVAFSRPPRPPRAWETHDAMICLWIALNSCDHYFTFKSDISEGK